MSDALSVLLLNGPNLGRLGKRKPEIYGTTSLPEVEAAVREALGATGQVVAIQSNAESALIDALERHREVFGAIVNPGALMIAGWSLRDALEGFERPWIEVHISNIHAREAFRHQSILAPLATGLIVGLGTEGYALAALYLRRLWERERP
ncbi:MAG: type II 3-dehydroquinate dehydratase [Enhygromyxa sp.]